MIDSRWAIAMVVRPFISGMNADCTNRSDVVSSDDVASSRIEIAILQHDPGDHGGAASRRPSLPRSPTTVS